MLVESLNNSIVIKEKTGNYIHNISQIVSKVTYKLLSKNPRLIADIENGYLEREILETEIIKILDEIKHSLDRDKIITETFNYIFGYGILQSYIENEEISDINGSRFNYFTCIKNGEKEKIDVKFSSETEFKQFCKLIIIRNGGIINESDSHARVSDENYKLRINVSISPRNTSGTSLSIRKHKTKNFTLKDLKNVGMFDDKIFDFLKGLKANILISGKGGAGKTTLLRAILNNYKDERILVCEKDSELYPEGNNFILQRVKKKKFGGKKLTLRDLIKDGLTMSLDGYCVGELVSNESIDFIKAGYSGHRILGTVHSLDAEDTLFRLLSLSYENDSKINKDILLKMIGKSLDYIIHIKKFRINKIIKIIDYNEGDFEIKKIFGKCN